MALGTAAILLLLETTEFIPGVRWLPYESAYNWTVKVTVRWPPKSHIHARAFLLAMSIPVGNIVRWSAHWPERVPDPGRPSRTALSSAPAPVPPSASCDGRPAPSFSPEGGSPVEDGDHRWHVTRHASQLVSSRAGSNGIDIEVSRHHAVSVSNFQSIKVSTDDCMVPF